METTTHNPAFVILAAGMGTRLGKPHPKCLTTLDNGETIMARQIRNIRAAFGKEAIIHIVVGFQLERIVETFPNERYITNSDYEVTNTSKSLLRALESINQKKFDGVVWMNGDVVFDEDLLHYFGNKITQNVSTISVDTKKVSEEEVKYTLNSTGAIASLSKTVAIKDALGESVGINYVSKEDITSLKFRLKRVNDTDYFEKGIEDSIQFDSTKWIPFDISSLGLNAVEVDFAPDLALANKTFS